MKNKIKMKQQTVNELKKHAEQNDYFWNGLFAVIYEEIRYKYTITVLTIGRDEKHQLPVSPVTIANYLSCRKKMDFKCFVEYCKGINSDILEKKYLELIPYINKTYAYLEEQDFTSGKISKSKNYRQKILKEIDIRTNDVYIWEREIAENEWEHEKILEVFNDLTQEELSILYRTLDGFSYVCGCDNFFIERYPQLNQKGQSLFKEVLEAEYEQQGTISDDEMYNFCQLMKHETYENMQKITPEILYMKLEELGFCSIYDAKNLKKFRHVTSDTWSVLALFHSVMFSYPNENIEGVSYGETDCLLILLNWLVNIPSLTNLSN